MSPKAPSKKAALIGRERELAAVRACLRAQKNVLLEGPVGAGKTHLALEIAGELKRPIFRVDGDSRYSEQKLTGWFDPPTVLKKGYTAAAFVAGPLVEAMKRGGLLFINELNRLPEGVQNVLLPAIDERVVHVPKLGEVRAAPGFLVIATQNPKEFVATSHLSEAILDRFELVYVDYQSESDEVAIVQGRLGKLKPDYERLARAAVAIARMTRSHPRIRRGASVRAAIGIAEIGTVFLGEGLSLHDAFLQAVLLSLPTRIEIERDSESGESARAELEALLKEWAEEALAQAGEPVKKKS